MKRIFLDLDGVLADFQGAAIKAYDLELTKLEKMDYAGVIKAFNRQRGKTANAFWAGLPDFFWEDLQETDEFYEIVEMVKPYATVILTSPPMGYPWVLSAIEGKTRWIMIHLREYFTVGRFLIGFHKEYFANRDSILIDDNQENCAKFIMSGGSAILVPRPWNYNRGIHVIPFIERSLRRIILNENDRA